MFIMSEAEVEQKFDVPQKGVTLRNIKKIFGEDTLVLKDISLDILDQEFLVLVGPSGCGKSTLLRIIAGLEFSNHGDVFINGKWVNREPPKDRNIAFVFQSYALYPHMTIRDNMSFSLRLKKENKKDINEKVDYAAKILNIDTQLHKKPAQLSGGQRQRVALGRAIVRDPDVFLLDEPLSNLDAKLRADMRAEIVRLQRKLGKTLIYVTHDQVEAMTMGDRIVILNEGEIQQIGTPIDVYERPSNKFVSGFIGTPTMNYLNVVLESGVLKIEEGIGEIPISDDQASILKSEGSSERFILGIRPECISLSNGDDPSDITTTIDVVEPLGALSNLSVLLHNDIFFTLMINGLCLEKEGTEKKISFDRKKIHIFDSETEKALLHGLN
jgi:multiple sugar transport system ATP-binding protein